MKKKTIYTHVSSKALKGILNISKVTGSRVYLYPIPYGENFDRWTVAIIRK